MVRDRVGISRTRGPSHKLAVGGNSDAAFIEWGKLSAKEANLVDKI